DLDLDLDLDLDDEFLENSQEDEVYDKSLLDQENHNNQHPRDSIISQDVAQKATDSIRSLMGAIPKKQQFYQNHSPAFKSGETVEGMIASLLEPKLEQWLNENLPTIVDKIVREEIKKLIPQDNN
ncbi:MAG: cell pole-organizing protein PopZ, partial [Rickettsiales bacterium]